MSSPDEVLSSTRGRYRREWGFLGELWPVGFFDRTALVREIPASLLAELRYLTSLSSLGMRAHDGKEHDCYNHPKWTQNPVDGSDQAIE
jgi:hypothetical protein